MRGKEKCKALKEIRRQIAEENDIPYVVSQCTHQGDCKGTCPKCESELRYLERELAVRQGLGKAVAVVGISASVCAGLTACSPVEMLKDAIGIQSQTAGTAPIGPMDLEGATELGPGDPAGEAPKDDYDGGMEVVEPYESGGEEQPGSEEETDVNEADETLPEGAGESEEMELQIEGMLLPPEEEPLDGMLLPPEEEPEETTAELAGDIPLPDAHPEEYEATGL
ncbi:MAG: hypothetical protein HDR02_10740 [Lachnospiraceae bacterium]|nr:hypothetical protein [Lachnospiraceae bacterium]